MRPPDFARFAIAAAAGVIAPYVWTELAVWWGIYVNPTVLETVWTVFALRGPPVFWMNIAVESVVFGALFGVGLWMLGSAKLSWTVAIFSIALPCGVLRSRIRDLGLTDNEMLAIALTAPSVVLLLAATAGTCRMLPRRKQVADA